MNMNKVLFNTVMENLKPFDYRKDGRLIMCSGMVPLDLCFVDERYQGLRQHKRIKLLENNWDVRKLTPIILVPHYEESRFAIVDGQGRFNVAPKKGLSSLQAIVLMDIPDDINERLKFEASYFIGQDNECENVKPFEKHPARLLIGNQTALELEELLDKYNVKITTVAGNKKSSVLGSYTTAYNVVEGYGKGCLEFAFKIIHNAGWDKIKNGYSCMLIRLFKNIYVAHPQNANEIAEFLSKKLRQFDPALLFADSISCYPKRQRIAAYTLFLEDMICGELEIIRRIHADGEKKYRIA